MPLRPVDQIDPQAMRERDRQVEMERDMRVVRARPVEGPRVAEASGQRAMNAIPAPVVPRMRLADQVGNRQSQGGSRGPVIGEFDEHLSQRAQQRRDHM